jgi:ligand-binding sensor domain-containing protein
MAKRSKITIMFSLVGLTWLLFSFYSPAAARELKFEKISLAQGLSQSTVQCILQDSKGFLWFGTADGLNQYDGNKFTVYLPVPGGPGSLSYKDVRAICEDRAGMLWVGTHGGGLNRFDPGTGNHPANPHWKNEQRYRRRVVHFPEHRQKPYL